MMKPLPSIDQVYQLIAQEEKQRSLSAMSQISNNAVAFNAGDTMLSKDCSAMVLQHKVYKNPSQGGLSRGQNFSASHTSSYPTRNSYYSGQASYASSNLSNNPGNKYGFKTVGPDRRQYFCGHCKIAGHSTQRCYKVHGYPPGHRLYRGKKMAATVHNDQTGRNSAPEGSSSQSSSVAPPLTTDQYSQLMQLLSKHSLDM